MNHSMIHLKRTAIKILRPYSALLLLTLRRIRHVFRVRLFALATLTAAAVRALVGAMTAKRVPAYLRLGNLPYKDSPISRGEGIAVSQTRNLLFGVKAA